MDGLGINLGYLLMQILLFVILLNCWAIVMNSIVIKN